MSYHLRELPAPQCTNCNARATVEIFNARNAPVGAYCKSCGKRAVARLNEREAQKTRQAQAFSDDANREMLGDDAAFLEGEDVGNR